jgi:hypothetical protein
MKNDEWGALKVWESGFVGVNDFFIPHSTHREERAFFEPLRN